MITWKIFVMHKKANKGIKWLVLVVSLFPIRSWKFLGRKKETNSQIASFHVA